MTHRHHTYYWQRCRECGAVANDYGQYCDDCSDRLDAENAAQQETDEREAEAADASDSIPEAFPCTCRTPTASSAALEPPEPILDRYCPQHGDGGPDPDRAYEERRDQILFDRDYPSPTNDED